MALSEDDAVQALRKIVDRGWPFVVTNIKSVDMRSGFQRDVTTFVIEVPNEALESAHKSHYGATEEAVTWAVNEAHAAAIRKTYPEANIKIMPTGAEPHNADYVATDCAYEAMGQPCSDGRHQNADHGVVEEIQDRVKQIKPIPGSLLEAAQLPVYGAVCPECGGGPYLHADLHGCEVKP